MNPMPQIIVEQVITSPPRKRTKCFDAEPIIMGEQLTDVEINFAQHLLKSQFKHVNGLHSTLQQDKKLGLTNELIHNKIQIIFCKVRKHWITATTINCCNNKVKIYDSLFRHLHNESLQVVENLFQVNGEKLKIKIMQCQKQTGLTDCGLFATAVAIAIASGLNPSKMNFRQEIMRAHLVNCFNKN